MTVRERLEPLSYVERECVLLASWGLKNSQIDIARSRCGGSDQAIKRALKKLGSSREELAPLLGVTPLKGPELETRMRTWQCFNLLADRCFLMLISLDSGSPVDAQIDLDAISRALAKDVWHYRNIFKFLAGVDG